MFRGRASKGRVGQEESLEARLQALGTLLDRANYTEQGLCILAVEGGFVVTGLKIPERGAAYSLAQHSETFEDATIAATIAEVHAS